MHCTAASSLHSGTPIIYKVPAEENYFDHIVTAYELFSNEDKISDYRLDQIHYHLKKIEKIASKALGEYLAFNIGFQRLNLLGHILDIPYSKKTPGTFVTLEFFQSLIQGNPVPEDLKTFIREILVPRQLTGSIKTQRLARDPYFPQWFTQFQALILNADQLEEQKIAVGAQIPSSVWNKALEKRIHIQNAIEENLNTVIQVQDLYYISMCLRKKYLNQNNEACLMGDKKTVDKILKSLISLIESTGEYKVPYTESLIYMLERMARVRGLTYKIVYPQ